jgi:hypothetical protein
MNQPMDLIDFKRNFFNVLLYVSFNEFLKVVELEVVQTMGFKEDKKTFSTLTFMKTRLWNISLCEHLDLVIPMYA